MPVATPTRSSFLLPTSSGAGRSRLKTMTALLQRLWHNWTMALVVDEPRKRYPSLRYLAAGNLDELDKLLAIANVRGIGCNLDFCLFMSQHVLVDWIQR